MSPPGPPNPPYTPHPNPRMRLADGRPLPAGPATRSSPHDHRHFPFKEEPDEGEPPCPMCPDDEEPT